MANEPVNIFIFHMALVISWAAVSTLWGDGRAAAQNVGINATGVAPNNSAMLDIESTEKGFLIPRMTTVQRDAIASPAEALQIFNADSRCLQFYINAQWQNIYCDVTCSGPPTTPGSIAGNAAPCTNATGEMYTIAQVAGATSYNWTVPSGAAITAGQGTSGIIVDWASTSGNVSVTASNNCGISAAQTLAVPLSTVPLAAGSISGTATVCQGDNGVAYSVGAVSGATSYVWAYSGSGYTCATGCATTSITAEFSGSAASGNLTVYGTNICGNGTASPNYAVTTNSTPVAPTAGTHTPTLTQVVWNWNTVTGATGYKYNTVNNYGTATDNGTSTTYTQTALTCNTAYTLYVWAFNTCGNSAVATLASSTTACTLTFDHTGSVVPWTVPAGVTSVTLECWGAQGGQIFMRLPVV